MEKREIGLNGFFFGIRPQASEQLLGFVGLWGVNWRNAEAFVGIGIGEPENWGKGYGSDAMRAIVHYGFMELGLHRISLFTFAYNPRAIRSHEKCGFQPEGIERRYLRRDGERYDVLMMGILRHAWQEKFGDTPVLP
jgi:RimJ/RimL family protein N-acetyltransferase